MGFEGRRDIRGQVLLDGLLESADEADEIDPVYFLSVSIDLWHCFSEVSKPSMTR